MGYDHANFTLNRVHLTEECGGAATTEYGKFFAFAKTRVERVFAHVTTAGTTASAASGFGIYNGTSSIGAITLSTNAAGYLGTTTQFNAALSVGDKFSFKSLADATVKAKFSIEHKFDTEADLAD